MGATTSQQSEAFLYAFVFGFIFDLLYILISSLLTIFRTDKKYYFIPDIFFSFLYVMINYIYAISMTEGRIRLFVIIAEAVGFCSMHLLIGKHIRKALIFISDKVKKLILKEKVIIFKLLSAFYVIIETILPDRFLHKAKKTKKNVDLSCKDMVK